MRQWKKMLKHFLIFVITGVSAAAYLVEEYFYTNATEKGCFQFRNIVNWTNNTYVDVKLLKNNNTTTIMFYYIHNVTTSLGVFQNRIEVKNLAYRNLSFCISNMTFNDSGMYVLNIGGHNVKALISYVLGQPLQPKINIITSGVLNTNVGNLTCQSESVSKPPGLNLTYTWTVNETVIAEGEKYHFQDLSHSSLLINVSREEPSNQYNCFATEQNGQSSNISEHRWLNPDRSPIVFLQLKRGVKKVFSGESVTLKCSIIDAFPNVTSISWLKNGKPVGVKTFSEFKIDNATKIDMANYSCIAYNGIGTNKSSNFRLDILYQAVIAESDHKNVSVNEPVNISCRASGNPLPTLTWKKFPTNSSVQESRLVNHSAFEISSVLEFTRPTCKDSATYTCSATNMVGKTVTSTSHLIVQCAPEVLALSSLSRNFEVAENQSFSFTEWFYGQPIPSFRLYFEDFAKPADLYGFNISTTKYESSFQTGAHIWKSNFEISELGKYILVAENSHGHVNITYVFNLPLKSRGQTMGHTLVTIAAICGAGLCLLLIIAVIVLIIRRRKTLYKEKEMELIHSQQDRDYLADNESGAVENRCDMSAGEVNVTKKEKVEYAEVQKRRGKRYDTTNTSEQKEAVKPKRKVNDRKDMHHSRDSTKNHRKNDNDANKKMDTNKPSIVYSELQFDNNATKKVFVIKEEKEKTDYADVDFSKHADPLPDSEEEDTDQVNGDD